MGQLVQPKIGCKWSMIALSVPLTLGWVLILIARPLDVSNLALFYAGRILLGMLRKYKHCFIILLGLAARFQVSLLAPTHSLAQSILLKCVRSSTAGLLVDSCNSWSLLELHLKMDFPYTTHWTGSKLQSSAQPFKVFDKLKLKWNHLLTVSFPFSVDSAWHAGSSWYSSPSLKERTQRRGTKISWEIERKRLLWFGQRTGWFARKCHWGLF